MKINKLALLLGFAITSALFLEVVARADEWDQSTTLTFNQPVLIPGRVLPAGTYQFKLADTNDVNVIRISNADGTHVYATLQTITAERRQPTSNTVVVMAEPGAGQPEALLKWFYPGSTSGHQFMYPDQQEQQLTLDSQQTIIAKQAAEAGD